MSMKWCKYKVVKFFAYFWVQKTDMKEMKHVNRLSLMKLTIGACSISDLIVIF